MSTVTMFKCQECVSVNTVNPEMKQKLKVEKHYYIFFQDSKLSVPVTELLLVPLLRKAKVMLVLVKW